jgi:zinc transport system substrate-binding protein
VGFSGSVSGNALLRLFTLSLFLMLQTLASCVVYAQPQVSASIKPLQMIALAITEGVSEPTLIIGAGQDPHHPALKPSERQKLADADLVLWVGPSLETAFTQLLDRNSSAVITAYDLIVEAGLATTDSNDAHIWLSTENSRVIAQALTAKLVELDALNQEVYEKNLADFFVALDLLDNDIENLLSDLSNNFFAVYHNAFTYYENQFALQHVASFTDNEEVQPGIRKIMEIREILSAFEVSCLLLEPANNADEIRQLTGREMNMVTIDVLGAAYPLTKIAYTDFMRDMSELIKRCIEE